MRIIPNHDPSDDDNDRPTPRPRRRDHGNRSPLHEIIGDTPIDEFGDILAEEIGGILAAAEPDNHPPTALYDTLAAHAIPAGQQPVKPVLRLVKTDDEDTDDDQVPTSGHLRSSVRPRLLRAGLAGSPFVVLAALAAGWGAPATVAAPIGVYALGWLAYLWWNAALRPPIPQVTATLAAAIGRGLAALITGIAAGTRAGVGRLGRTRTRRENQRTATA